MSALLPTILPMTEAKRRLTELLELCDTEDIVITRRGRAVAVLISIERYRDLLDRIEAAEDTIAAMAQTDS